MKRCAKCGREKPLKDFLKNGYVLATCDHCREMQRKIRENKKARKPRTTKRPAKYACEHIQPIYQMRGCPWDLGELHSDIPGVHPNSTLYLPFPGVSVGVG